MCSGFRTSGSLEVDILVHDIFAYIAGHELAFIVILVAYAYISVSVESVYVVHALVQTRA